jgi:hypothetical protein
MNKLELTKLFLTQTGKELTDQIIKNATWAWWCNPTKSTSFRLTDNGHDYLVNNVQLQSFEFKCKDVDFTAYNLLRIDKAFTCPFYLHLRRNSIILFGGHDASMLSLMNGDVFSYLKSFD